MRPFSIICVLWLLLVGSHARADEPKEKKTATTIMNLKALGLALHEYHDSAKSFPLPGSLDKKGKPLLSWRVAVLPYLEEKKLYDEFHLDEPWDSDHNKKLIEKMPGVFANPRVPLVEKGMTTFQVPVGPLTLFEAGRARSISVVRDGTSNTLMMVEVSAKQAIVWTKPEDLRFDPASPVAGLHFDEAGMTLGLLVEGSVKMLPAKIGAENFRRYFLVDDGRMPVGAQDIDN